MCKLPTQRQVRTGKSIFGEAIPKRPSKQLGIAYLPYPMKLSWNEKQTVNRITCHRLIINNVETAFKEILAHYGLCRIQSLGLDIYGGCYNYRKMRGGRSLSMHAWGLAIDLDPLRNGNRVKWADAQFSKPEYKAFIKIMEANGFLCLGKVADRDGMHFQVTASLV